MQLLEHLTRRGGSCVLIPPEKEIAPISSLTALISRSLQSCNHNIFKLHFDRKKAIVVWVRKVNYQLLDKKGQESVPFFK